MSGMLRQWEQALERHRKRSPRNLDWDSAERIVSAILAELGQQSTVEDLRKRYAKGNFWALQIARRLAPNDARLHNLHFTADIAYGRRYLELTQTASASPES